MPRKAKEKMDEVEEKTVKKETKKQIKDKKVSTKTTKPKKSTEKKATATKAAAKKVAKKVEKLDKAKKSTTKKSTKNATAKVAKKSVTTKKTTAKKTPSKTEKEPMAKEVKTTNSKKSSTKASPKKTTTKKATTKKATTKKATAKKTTTKKIEVLEYYDLPYRYNKTVVKILAQTPNTLFVYWDISDENKEYYIKHYGEYFFNNTKPVLIIHNKTMNYSFEIDINDFANSWYLKVSDSNCNYQIELGRRPINEYVQIENNYLYITTSNNMMSQNDHILFEKLSHFVYYRNVKTGELIKKNINLSLLTKIGKLSNIKELYRLLYPNEDINFEKLDLRNPSSGSSTFK